MAKKYPYPETEHYDFPETADAVIFDQMRYYSTPVDFRESIVGLGRIYLDTKLMFACRKFAVLMAVADPERETDAKLAVDNDFLAGEIVGLHAIVSPLRNYIGQQILSCDPLREYNPGDKSVDPDNTRLRLIEKNMAELRTSGWQDILSSHDPKMQAAFTEAAAHTYGDIAGSQRRQEAFMVGELFVADLMIGISKDEYS
jgi:hypothetical protein